MILILAIGCVCLCCAFYVIGYNDGMRRATGKFVPKSARTAARPKSEPLVGHRR